MNEERLERLQAQNAFINLGISKKKDSKEREKDENEGRKQQGAILAALRTLPSTLFQNRALFEKELDRLDLSLPAPLRKAVLAALSEREESAEICLDKHGQPEPDPELRDTENVPLSEDIHAFFAREVEPHRPDAWINLNVRDEKDGQAGRVGYEINFNRYFYEYRPPRDLEEIEAEIKALEKEIMDMLKEVTE